MRIKLLLLLALIICCSESGKSQPDQRVKTQGRILSSERIAVDVNFLIDSIKGIITMRKEEPINLGLNYYNLAGAATTTLKDIMSAEILLTFRRDSPWRPAQPLRSNLQLKCFFMNAYLQEGGW